MRIGSPPSQLLYEDCTVNGMLPTFSKKVTSSLSAISGSAKNSSRRRQSSKGWQLRGSSNPRLAKFKDVLPWQGLPPPIKTPLTLRRCKKGTKAWAVRNSTGYMDDVGHVVVGHRTSHVITLSRYCVDMHAQLEQRHTKAGIASPQIQNKPGTSGRRSPGHLIKITTAPPRYWL
jgi:hypothetical protein